MCEFKIPNRYFLSSSLRFLSCSTFPGISLAMWALDFSLTAKEEMKKRTLCCNDRYDFTTFLFFNLENPIAIMYFDRSIIPARTLRRRRLKLRKRRVPAPPPRVPHTLYEESSVGQVVRCHRFSSTISYWKKIIFHWYIRCAYGTVAFGCASVFAVLVRFFVSGGTIMD